MGVASNYLSHLSIDDMVQIAVRPSHAAFQLPLTPEATPIICIAAGTGIGPFRGFIQERSVQISTGRRLAPALLFFACLGHADDLYRDEFDRYEEQGVVVVKRAYSREMHSDEVAGCKYIQDRLLKDKKEVGDLWEKGAKIFVCGGQEMGHAVEQACIEMLRDMRELTLEEAKELLEKCRNERFSMDVFT